MIKLKQAEYHFNNMTAKLMELKYEEFTYELCAFVESSRNITWAMQNEYSNNEKFNQWYSTKQKEMNEDHLLKFFKERRTEITKRGHAGVSAFTFYLEMFFSVKPLETVGVILSKGIFTPEEEIKAKTKSGEEIPFKKKIIRTPVFTELESKHVIEACKEYLTKMQGLVKECRQIIEGDIK